MLLGILLVPLLGAFVCWFLGPQLKRSAGWVGSAAIAIPFVLTLLSWGAGTQTQPEHVALLSWLPGYDFGLQLDPLSLIWTLIITGVGCLIHIYSIGYMDGDRGFARFFGFMNLFVFAMLLLVLSDNFVGLLIGWGLVGLASYFLIGFWFDRPAAVAAARKSFVINVIGDIAIMFAIFVMFKATGTVTYSGVFADNALLNNGPVVIVICIALFIGAAAKSAQVPLQTWLPDAMEGPTPVSALIHAATMVTAGVYLIARCAPLWSKSPDAQMVVGTIGALSMLLGALLGLAQWDIKRVLAYSTISQIGYMIMGVGVGAYAGGVAHFFTHGFFKAQLFLGSGLIIHALANEQDMRKMGGLVKKLPFAFIAMLTGVLAICGIPPFSGFFSKDQVISGALAHGHPWMYAVGVVTAGITSYYMCRLLFMTFFGTYRGDVKPADLGMPDPAPALPPLSDAHHAPSWIMALPVAILIVPTIAAGWVMIGTDSPWARFLGGLFPIEQFTAPISENATSLIVLLVVLLGIALAYWRYATKPALENAVPRLRAEALRMPAVLTNAFYFDAAIDMLIIRSSQFLGRVFGTIVDPHVIDGGVREAAFSARRLGDIVRWFQSGLVRAYALLLAFGAVCFIAYFAIAGAVR